MNGLPWYLLVGLTAGWLAGVLVKGEGFGVSGDIVGGVLGAVIGGFLLGSVGISAGGLPGSMLAATIGAVILIFDVRLFQKSIAAARALRLLAPPQAKVRNWITVGGLPCVWPEEFD